MDYFSAEDSIFLSVSPNKMKCRLFVAARRNQNLILDKDTRRRAIFALGAKRIHKKDSWRQTPYPINLPRNGRSLLQTIFYHASRVLYGTDIWYLMQIIIMGNGFFLLISCVNNHWFGWKVLFLFISTQRNGYYPTLIEKKQYIRKRNDIIQDEKIFLLTGIAQYYEGEDKLKGYWSKYKIKKRQTDFRISITYKLSRFHLFYLAFFSYQI